MKKRAPLHYAGIVRGRAPVSRSAEALRFDDKATHSAFADLDPSPLIPIAGDADAPATDRPQGANSDDDNRQRQR